MPTPEEMLAGITPQEGPPPSVWRDVPLEAPPSAAPGAAPPAKREVVALVQPSVTDKGPPGPLKFTLRPHVTTDGLDATLVGISNRLFDEMPEDLRKETMISSGRRTSEQQAAAYSRYLSGKGGLAAPPGRSRHEVGAALDFNGTSPRALKWLTANAPRFGAEFPFGARDPAHMQLTGAGAQAADVTQARIADGKADSPEAMLERLPVRGSADSVTPGVPSGTGEGESLSEALGTGLSEQAKAELLFGEQAGSLVAGIAKGAAHVPLGVAQAVLPRSMMEPLEERIRSLEGTVQNVFGEHEGFDITGRIIGSTAAILVGARALGAGVTALAPIMPRLLTSAWTALGPLGRTAATSGAIGGTAYYPEGPEREGRFGAEQFVPGGARTIDTALGTLFGAMAGTVVKGVDYAARQLAGQRYASSFLGTIQKTVGDLTRNTEVPLTDAVTHYKRVAQQAAEKYGLRNVQGQQFEGFPSGVGAAEAGAPEGLKQALDTALDATKSAGVNVRTPVQTVVNRVRDILGLNAEEGRLAEWKVAQQAYQEAQINLTAEIERKIPAAVRDNPNLVGEMQKSVQAMQLYGQLPPTPLPPAAYTPRPVPAERYAQARTALNEAWRRTRDPAAKTQVKMVLNELDHAAAAAAKDYGLPSEEFLRKAITANRYYEQNVAPLRQFFGNKLPSEVEGRAGVPFSGVTPAQFYDKVVKIVENGDTRAAGDLAQALGSRGRDNMVQIMASRALEKVQDGAVRPAYEYVKANEEVIRTLIGRDAYTELIGYAKIGDEIAESFKRAKGKEKMWTPVWDWSHSFGPALIAYKLFEGHFKQAAMVTLALPAYHFAKNVVQATHEIPLVKPLVRRAATMKPGSEELDNLIRTIERRVRVATAAASRAPQP